MTYVMAYRRKSAIYLFPSLNMLNDILRQTWWLGWPAWASCSTTANSIMVARPGQYCDCVLTPVWLVACKRECMVICSWPVVGKVWRWTSDTVGLMAAHTHQACDIQLGSELGWLRKQKLITAAARLIRATSMTRKRPVTWTWQRGSRIR